MTIKLKNRIEAILYASGKGISVENLTSYTGENTKKVKQALKKLQEEYDDKDTSLTVKEHNGMWKLTVKGEYTEDVKAIVNETELASAILKTLAVIVYKSPVLQSDIIDMRGQGAYDHIKELVKEKFITKEKSGRSYLLKITEKFYDYFDVEGDEEIREVFDNLRQEQASQQQLQVVNIAGNKESSESAKKGEEKRKSEGEEAQEHVQIVDAGTKEGSESTDNTPVKKADNTSEKTDDKTENKTAKTDDKESKSTETEEAEKAAEREEENNFLDEVEKRIDKISKNVQNETLPSQGKHTGEETETETGVEGNTNMKDTASENDKTESAEDSGNKQKEEKESLESIESFVDEQKKKEDKKKYL